MYNRELQIPENIHETHRRYQYNLMKVFGVGWIQHTLQLSATTNNNPRADSNGFGVGSIQHSSVKSTSIHAHGRDMEQEAVGRSSEVHKRKDGRRDGYGKQLRPSRPVVHKTR